MQVTLALADAICKLSPINSESPEPNAPDRSRSPFFQRRVATLSCGRGAICLGGGGIEFRQSGLGLSVGRDWRIPRVASCGELARRRQRLAAGQVNGFACLG